MTQPTSQPSSAPAEQQQDAALASIPIVVVSADGGVQQKAASFGGEYLAKPVRIETVLAVVERYCAS
jgi:CheY-like chemotaxis protein